MGIIRHVTPSSSPPIALRLASLDRAAYQVAIGSLFILLMVGIWILRGVPQGEPENEQAGMRR